MKIILAAASMIVLGACSPAQQAIYGSAVDNIKSANDAFAQTTLQADCAIPYGAYVRLPKNQQLAIELNCGGDWLNTLRNLGVVQDRGSEE